MIEINGEFFKSVLEHIYDGVYVVDAERKLLYWNKAAELISGYSYTDVVGHYCWDNILQHVNDEGCNLCKTGCPLEQTIKDGRSRKDLVYLHHKNGHRVPVFVRVNPIKDDAGNTSTRESTRPSR